jgi:uncharacterized protein (DUF1778 family)
MKAKSEVIQLRVKDKDKELLKAAAIKEEVSLSNFMLEAGINKAKRILSKDK